MTLYILMDDKYINWANEELLTLLPDREYQLIQYSEHSIPDLAQDSHVLLYLSDAQLHEVLLGACEHQWQIAILPHPESSIAMKAYGTSNKIKDAIQDALTQEAVPVDLMLCHNVPVLQSVVIGHVFGLRPGGQVEGTLPRLKHIHQSIRQLKRLIPKKFELDTHKEEKVITAAIGITVVEHGTNSILGKSLLPKPRVSDGKFHVIILAPHSWMETVMLLVKAIFTRTNGKLPNCIGLIETSSLKIASSQEFTYRLDDVENTAQELEIHCYEKPLKVIPGRELPIEKSSTSAKESRRTHHLPVGEAVEELTSKPLNMVTRAASEEFRDLYNTLNENARFSSSFIILMILSTLLASLGLLANSSPVIIGAMILAPLMGPIISFSMALLRWDTSLLKTSAKTLWLGLLIALFFAVCLSPFLPADLTDEIASRVRPNLIDLGVAVLSGIAGAYATARIAIAKSLAGVSIAVALVPPLAVTGLGLSWWESSIFLGAFLLFITNLAGIILASAMTFFALGFSPFKRAKQGLTISSLIVLMICIPLFSNFSTMVMGTNIKDRLVFDGETFCRDVKVNQVDVSGVAPMRVNVHVSSTQILTPSDYECIQQRLFHQLKAMNKKTEDIKKDFKIELSSSIRLN